MIRLIFAALCGVAFCCPSTVAVDDPIKKDLDTAKVAYESEVEKFRKAIGEWFDKREEAARKDGNKKLVDQIKAERQTFDEQDEVPKNAPAQLKQRLASARAAMEFAYGAAVKAYTRARKDDEAAAIEKELDKYRIGGGSALPEKGSLHSLQPKGEPKHYVRHADFVGVVGNVPDGEVYRQSSAFYMEAGLAGENTISFRSINYPDHYLCQENFRIVLRKVSDKDSYRKNATFKPVAGLAGDGGFSFEAVNFPGYFVRHRGGRLVVERYDATSQFRKDATFVVTTPIARP